MLEDIKAPSWATLYITTCIAITNKLKHARMCNCIVQKRWKCYFLCSYTCYTTYAVQLLLKKYLQCKCYLLYRLPVLYYIYAKIANKLKHVTCLIPTEFQRMEMLFPASLSVIG